MTGKRPGRPKLGDRKLIRITVWLAPHELAALELAAKAEKVSRFVRGLILERLTGDRTRQLSERLRERA